MVKRNGFGSVGGQSPIDNGTHFDTFIVEQYLYIQTYIHIFERAYLKRSK